MRGHTIIVTAIGLICSAMLLADIRPLPEDMPSRSTLIAELAGLALLMPLIVLTLHQRMQKTIDALHLTDGTQQRVARYYLLPYALFLTYGFVLAGVKPNLTLGLLLLLLFAVAMLAVLWLAADRPQRSRWLGSAEALPLLFFVSGFAALIYQVVWQRVLFATFGIDIESVTIIVSVFMFGLGMGALGGGWLQRRFPQRLLECFVAIELAIGIFGLCSIPLIRAAGNLAPDSLLALTGVTFALLALPTMLMGATLPLLVTYLHARFANVGKTVGKLYAYNTFGSALAAFLTVNVFFVVFGQQGTLIVAFLCNLSVAAFANGLRRQLGPQAVAASSATADPASGKFNTMPFALALLLSSVVGYASLSLEILWFRVIGFITAGKPQVFGLTLAVFLAGVASGSLRAKRRSENGSNLHGFIWQSLIGLAITA